MSTVNHHQQYLHIQNMDPEFSFSNICIFRIWIQSLAFSTCTCAARVTVVLCVCLSTHAILAVRTIKSITKDTIMLSVRFVAILKNGVFL